MVLAFKGFAPDLSCTSGGNRFEYSETEWNECPEANCVKNGFHCALDPLDCLTYYPDMENAVYYAVIADGDIDEDGTDTKISCTRMRLVKKLDKVDFVRMSLLYMADNPRLGQNRNVCHEMPQKMPQNGFVIIRGKNPLGMGRTGDIIGLAREYAGSCEIKDFAVFRIDGKKFLPGRLYGVDDTEVENYEKETD